MGLRYRPNEIPLDRTILSEALGSEDYAHIIGTIVRKSRNNDGVWTSFEDPEYADRCEELCKHVPGERPKWLIRNGHGYYPTDWVFAAIRVEAEKFE